MATDVFKFVPDWNEHGAEIAYRIYCLALGLAGFAVLGTWYYLRRVEP